MRALLLALLLQVSGVLSGPDPAQMEKAPDLGYKPVPANLVLPDGMKMGAPSSVALECSPPSSGQLWRASPSRHSRPRLRTY